MAFNAADYFLVTAVVPLALTQNLKIPVLLFGETLIHPEQIPCEESGFVATGSGPDLQENIAVIVWVSGYQVFLQFSFQLLNLPGRGYDFFFAEFTYFSITVFAHFLCCLLVLYRLSVLQEQRDDRLQACILARQVAEAVLVTNDLRIGKQAANFLVAGHQLFQIVN